MLFAAFHVGEACITKGSANIERGQKCAMLVWTQNREDGMESMERLKTRLIEAGRVLAAEGQGDYVAGHVSLRLPDEPDRFLMKPAGIGLEEMTARNIILVDLDGRKLSGGGGRHNEVFIHSEVLRARPDVQAVVHTHALHVVVFSALGKPFLPVSNDGAFFSEGLPIFDETTDLIIDIARGEAVARVLGPHGTLILRNHGLVAAASTIEEAVWNALKLDRACRMQWMAEAAGGAKCVSDPADAKAKNARANRSDIHQGTFDYVLRRLESSAD
jgi:L-fuculose-phosphate aldolase